MSIALIAANWAVFGTLDRILDNLWSKGSIFLLVLNLVLNWVGAKLMSQKLCSQWEKAERSPEEWSRAWEEAERNHSPWPFTSDIQALGRRLRACKLWLPLLAGLCFIVALLRP